LEHVERDEAVDLLQRAEAAGAWHILVSVPLVDSQQGEVDGNPHEAHVHQWDADDMDHVLAQLGGRVETMRG
ncbi:class I SAM-dependent methyltransferase, partial [Streptomyces sp. A73]|nr:class I SAM-dependent methyltransferase [Streptomyces sp. A73]